MKTILEIQKLDRQIRLLNRETDKSPASMEYKKYRQMLQEGRELFEQLDKQAGDIIRSYEKAQNTFSKVKGESDILKKQNTATINLENAGILLNNVNSLVGEISEENRHVEDLVRRAEEIVRKTNELSGKLTEAKKRSIICKQKIEEEREKLNPKIQEIEKQIKALEPSIKDTDKYEKYKEMKEKGIFPVFVNIEGDFCGGCKVELPLNFIEKLKEKKMLPCEHCGRIIMFK